MPSVRDLEQWLAKLESDEADLQAQLGLTREAMDDIRRTLEKQLALDAKRTGLTSGTIRTKVRDEMQVQPGIPSGRKVGRPIESEHPFPAWLSSRNITVTEWAADHNDPDTGKPYKRERVKSWFADGAGGRPAPRHAIDLIEKESMDAATKKSAVPATKRTWKNGIRE